MASRRRRKSWGPTPLLLLLALAACSAPPAKSRFAELTYHHLPPLGFDVAAIERSSRYQPPGQPPNMEQLFPVPPKQAALAWAEGRLRALGASRRLRFTVLDAAAVETRLDSRGGLTGLLTTEQTERYEAHLAVLLEILGAGGGVEASARAEARRSVTVPENASLNDRERVWFALTEKLMLDLDRQLETTIREVLGAYLRPIPGS